MKAALGVAARHGRLALVLGLVAGVTAPGLAATIKPWLPELVAGLLFVAALRIGPRQAVGAARDVPRVGALVLLYQVALPMTAVLVFQALGLSHGALATAVVLMLSAPSIAGSPSLTVMVGHDPAPALRLLVASTLAVPVTVLPVFWLLPELGSGGAILAAAGSLLAVIGGSVAVAFALRVTVLRVLTPPDVAALDGLAAIGMAVVVVGLMSAIGPALRETPGELALWFLVAVAANFGFQLLLGAVLPRFGFGEASVAYAVIAGNRNIALFLVALPSEITDPLLMFIGCYQIPMFLTPLLMRGFYARVALRGS